MATANNILLQQALEAIFDKQPTTVLVPTNNFATPTVRVTSKKVVPEQSEALAQTCLYLGQHPSIMRSGENITFVFSC